MLLERDVLVNERHRVEGLIGVGGLSMVYEAQDQRLNLRVALKVLHDEGLVDAGMIERFLREGRVVVQLDSPHIAKAYDFGFCERLGVMYIALELLRGADLEQLLVNQGPLPVVRAVDYTMQALAGVAAAHVEGIVHRDLKPANLFLAEQPGRPPVVKVLDFGIAKALRGAELGRALPTASLDVFGTPLYMAPEQIQSAKGIDERADIWSIGVILYELLAGATPFVGVSLAALLNAILDDGLVPLVRRCPDVSPALAAVVHRCLQRDRALRFPTVMELAFGLAPFGSVISAQALDVIENVFRSRSQTATALPSGVTGLPALDEDDDAETALKRHLEEEDDEAETALNRHDAAPTHHDQGEDSLAFELITEEMIAQPFARNIDRGPVVPAPRIVPTEAAKEAADEAMRLRRELERIAFESEHVGAPGIRRIAREALDRKR
jgi:serine/threonine-protein kinase